MTQSIFSILLVLVFSPNLVYSQESVLNCTDSAFCVPGVIGLPRSKGIVIKREVVRDYAIRSSSAEEYGNAEADVIRNRRYSFKLRFPIVVKDNISIAGGIKYFVEEFNFENPQPTDYSFYQNLEDKSLKSLRADLFVMKPTRTNKYFLLRVSAGLNGDYTVSNAPTTDFLRFSIAPLIGWKRNDYVSYAFGVGYSYSFGRRRVFPVLVYNKTFSNQWGMESVLPAEAKLRYNTLNQKNYMYLKAELDGANYGLRLEDQNDQITFLEKSEVRFLISWEREIHDWLWFSIESGFRTNIDFDLTDSPTIRSDRLIENNLNIAFTYGFSLFIVTPRKFLK
ncbi:MAG: DUF6268 family outer membrane beta-barrel protein [Bacteroidota bacterium]